MTTKRELKIKLPLVVMSNWAGEKNDEEPGWLETFIRLRIVLQSVASTGRLGHAIPPSAHNCIR